MSFANKHNRGSKFDVDITNWPYKKLEELFKEGNKIFKIQGLFISSKGKFGEQPIAICDGYCVNMPSYMVDECKNILSDDEDIAAIKAGAVGFSVEQYIDKKFGKTCYGVSWEDIQ